MPIAVTFLDLAKAFDTVNHKILLDKLYACGIRGKGHKLIESSLLFILYENDLLAKMSENSMLSYADDTAIIAKGKTWKDVENQMNKYLEEVSIWLRLNKLTLNIQKMVYITFSNYSDSVPSVNNINIKINKELLERVTETKYLGIKFDTNMRWSKHI